MPLLRLVSTRRLLATLLLRCFGTYGVEAEVADVLGGRGALVRSGFPACGVEEALTTRFAVGESRYVDVLRAGNPEVRVYLTRPPSALDLGGCRGTGFS